MIDQSWITAFTGGLAGALLTFTFQWLLAVYRRPRLQVIFDQSEPGCAVDAVPDLQRYLRLKVRNVGRTTAHQVGLSITSIIYEAPDGTRTPFNEEVLDLKAGMTGDQLFNLPPEAHRFADLALSFLADQMAQHSFDFVRHPRRLEGFAQRVGRYKADVFVSANDAAPRRLTVEWEWDGSIAGLNIVGYGYRF